MAFATPGTPNLADFWTFLNETVQIPTAALPTSSPWPGYAFTEAQTLVLTGEGTIPGLMVSLATYNCATHLLFLITPDQTGQTYFATKRGNTGEGYNLNAPSSGLVVASSDESTSATLTAPEWAKGMTVEDLDFFKTLWGRRYLSFIQKYGPTIWGLS